MNMTRFDKDFAVFILTHGRADKVVTYEAVSYTHLTLPTSG